MFGLNFPDREKIYGYLGCKSGETDAKTENDIDLCVGKILNAARPGTVLSPPLPLRRGEGGALFAGESALEGKDIKEHLEGCETAVFAAVTLGADVDVLIRRTEAVDMAEAVVLNAVSDAAAETLAEFAEKKLREELRAEKKYTTQMFSPGYGDFPSAFQRELLRICDARRKIGLSATEDNILIPKKSITGVFGAAAAPVTGKRADCGRCALKDKCIYRKRGGNREI